MLRWLGCRHRTTMRLQMFSIRIAACFCDYPILGAIVGVIWYFGNGLSGAINSSASLTRAGETPNMRPIAYLVQPSRKAVMILPGVAANSWLGLLCWQLARRSHLYALRDRTGWRCGNRIEGFPGDC